VCIKGIGRCFPGGREEEIKSAENEECCEAGKTWQKWCPVKAYAFTGSTNTDDGNPLVPVAATIPASVAASARHHA